MHYNHGAMLIVGSALLVFAMMVERRVLDALHSYWRVAWAAAVRLRHVNRPKLTLRAKGVIALTGLVVHMSLLGLYVGHERAKQAHVVQQLEHNHDVHELLAEINSGLTHSMVTLEAFLKSQEASTYDDIVLDLAAFAPRMPELKARFPDIAAQIDRFKRHAEELERESSPDVVTALLEGEQKLAARLEHIMSGIEHRGYNLTQNYHKLNRRVTVVVTIANLIALGVLGVVGTVFFSKLASDIRMVETRAMAIVDGYRGAPMEVRRDDEMGSLMEAVNRMQSELRHRERQQEILAHERFHQDKMAAVGSLAAAVAHEIMNPIDAISGIAQTTIDDVDSHKRLDGEMLRYQAVLMLKQTGRIASIVRQIADLAIPRSPDPELLDLNALVEANCNFVRYDKRFYGVDLILGLDDGIHSVHAVSDHLTQVLMNLLLNAADATEGIVGRKRTIRVGTRQPGNEVELSVHDNGHGMDRALLLRVFEESFTTKPRRGEASGCSSAGC